MARADPGADAIECCEPALPAITFAQIEDFKGTESSYVAVIDIDRFSATPRDLALVYVAMSRARAGLWVAYEKDLEAEIKRAAAFNAGAMTSGSSASG